MMTSDFVIDVNDTNFEYEVVAYSQNVPVVVDFWASWCKPCKLLSPMLEHFANMAHGSFRLARVNVDESPNLAIYFGVRTLPTVKAFSEGEVIAEMVGVQPENRVVDFLNNLTPPSPLSLAVEKGMSLLNLHQWTEAEEVFREVLEHDPEQPASLLGLAKSLLGRGESGEALPLLRNFPASRLYSTAELLRPYAEALNRLQAHTLPEETDQDVTFSAALRLAKRGNIEAALDGLLDILRADKRYAGGKAHQVALSLLELLGEDDPQTRQYRSELASILF